MPSGLAWRGEPPIPARNRTSGEELAQVEPALVDDGDWLARARSMSCYLPPRLVAAIRAFRHEPGPDGRLTITNLPVDGDSLPPTPQVPDSAQHRHRPGDHGGAPVGLLCLRPAHAEQVGTQVAAIRRAFPLISEPNRAVLREPRFVTAAPPSFRSAGQSPRQPVLLGTAGTRSRSAPTPARS